MDAQDFCMMSDRLSRAQRLVPELQQCSLDMLQAVLAHVHAPTSDLCGDERDSGSSSESEYAEPQPAERPATGPRPLPPLASFSLPGLHASLACCEVRLAIVCMCVIIHSKRDAMLRMLNGAITNTSRCSKSARSELL